MSVVLPVYNEQGHLVTEIERIRAALAVSPYSFEIIVVDDGSTDGSGAKLREIEGIRLIQFVTNRGTGSARKAGTHAARGRVVVWTDVDMSYPNEEIPQLVKELDGYDQVVGARTSEQGTATLRPRPGQVVHPPAGQLPGRHPHPRPQLRPAGVPGRRGPPVPAPAAPGVLLRHHAHDDVPRATATR